MSTQAIAVIVLFQTPWPTNAYTFIAEKLDNRIAN